jgi:membrane protease YdiL (CAAX protease family)
MIQQQLLARNLTPIVAIISLPAVIIALVELLEVMLFYKPGMSIVQLLGGSNAYFTLSRRFVYLVVLTACFPLAWSLFLNSHQKLSDYIYQNKKLFGDIAVGLLSGLVTFALSFNYYHNFLGVTLHKLTSTPLTVLSILSLTLASGFFKELYFRGLPMIFLQEHVGKKTAFFLGNILFAILDWPNLGASFVWGTIWFLAYNKRQRLIVPMLAHGFHNLLAIMASLGILSFIGIIPK